MASYEERAKQRFGELSSKIEKLKAKKTSIFSKDALLEFGRGFHSPVIGSLAYLQDNTTTHNSICCITDCQQLKGKTITSDKGYDEFTDELMKLTPPAGIDFTFLLTNSIYPIGDIADKFSVYFKDNNYEIVYGEFRLVKEYMTHIEPDEIRQLRDLIAVEITEKVGREIDKLTN